MRLEGAYLTDFRTLEIEHGVLLGGDLDAPFRSDDDELRIASTSHDGAEHASTIAAGTSPHTSDVNHIDITIETSSNAAGVISSVSPQVTATCVSGSTQLTTPKHTR